MESYADMSCVLKINFECGPCKSKVMEVLGSICGVYSVTINAEGGTVEVGGEVDPNVLLWALTNSGSHAELLWVKFSSPRRSSGYSGYSGDHNDDYGSSYGYGSLDRSYGYGMNLQYNTSRRLDPWYNVDYGYLPPARYVPGLPHMDPYEHGKPINVCSIM